MSKFKDLVGQRFGRLLVIKRVDNKILSNGSTKAQWLCKCDCGNNTIVVTDRLTSGNTKSCGCFNKESSRKRILSQNIKHGLKGTRIYSCWNSMKNRCLNINSPEYHIYGGRGITICEEWKHNFISFYSWAIANNYSDKLTLDRIDVNGNYCPENCRWVTMKEQGNNRRNNRFITYKDKTLSIAQWSRELNIPQGTLWNRIYRFNWSIEKAFNIL